MDPDLVVSHIYTQTGNCVNFCTTGSVDISTHSDSKFRIHLQSIHFGNKSDCGNGNNDNDNVSRCTELIDFTLLGGTTDEPLLSHVDPINGEIVKMQKGIDYNDDCEVAMGRKYTLLNNSPLPGNGALKIDVLPIIKTGYASTCTSSDQPDRYLSSQGDLKYNITLEWPDDSDEDSETFVYLKIDYKSSKGIRKLDHLRHISHIDGMDVALYIPNQYYSFNRKSGAMELQTMESGYPNLSPMDENGIQTLTVQFQMSTKISFDFIFEHLPQYVRVVKGDRTFEETEVGSKVPIKNILRWIYDLVGTDVMKELFPHVTGSIEDVNVQKRYTTILWGASGFSKRILNVEGELKGSLLIFTFQEKKIESSNRWFSWFGRVDERTRMDYSLYFGQPQNDAAKKELEDIMNWGTRFASSFFEYRSSKFDEHVDDKTKANMKKFEVLRNEEGDYRKRWRG